MAKKKYYQRPDGLFEVSRTINGKRIMFRGKTCREVDQKILAYQEKRESGRTFPEVADEWERQHEKGIREETRRVYGYAVKRLKASFPGPIGDIRPIDIMRHIHSVEAMGYAGETVGIELSVCKMICSYAVLAGDIDVSPAAEVRKSRGLPRKKRLALTEEQEAVVKRAGLERTAPFWLFAYFLLYTGLRRGEALALSYSDVDRKAGVIHINKKLSYAYGNTPVMDGFTKSENGIRDVPLLPPLADALPRDRVGLIFPDDDGGFLKKAGLVKNWKAYCRTVGFIDRQTVVRTEKGVKREEVIEQFPITPHCLRHSFATICYEAGLDPRQAAQILGDTTQVLEGVYTHLRDAKRRTAAEKLIAHFG